MSFYITISEIQVQYANAVSGITYGFPGVTQFLGFTHALSRKLEDVTLNGCGIVFHKHQNLVYRNKVTTSSGAKYWSDYFFKQTKNSAYARYEKDKIGGTPSIIEEGKMHFTASLVIECEGFLGNEADKDILRERINRISMSMRVASGFVTSIKNVFIDGDESDSFYRIRRRLIPGFVLMDRSEYLTEHPKNKKDTLEADMLDAWLDFSALKYAARPKHDLIDRYLKSLEKEKANGELASELNASWERHLNKTYQLPEVPEKLVMHFLSITSNRDNEDLLDQWGEYCEPTQETKAKWERVPTGYNGYLVPISIGFQPISDLYDARKVMNSRDPDYPFCFVEAVYGIGEWMSPHKLNSVSEIIWRYSENEHYLCEQNEMRSDVNNNEMDDIDLILFNEDDENDRYK